MGLSSDEEYFHKLDNMVIRSTHYLRQIFKQRWKVESGEDWMDDQSYVQKFLVQHCEHIIKKAIPLQKKILLASCSLEDWDITIMSLVLSNFGDEKKYEIQNQAIRRLKNLRNDLAHHKSKKFTQIEYSEKLKVFKEILFMLEINKSEIKSLVKEFSISSSLEDTVRLKSLLKNAEEMLKLQDFKSALNQYSEALNIPRLSSDNLGNLYEKRAACYLNMEGGHNIDEKHTDQATLDVEQALKLNDSSWNVYYLNAQCYQAKNNLREAIRYYEMALAMSPIQKKVKQDLDACRLKYSIQKSLVDLNLDNLPLKASDLVGEYKDDSGQTLTLKKAVELNSFENAPVILGEMYYNGWEVPQDYAKAIRYYAQAEKQGYAEGSYKLGLCYYYGHGVQQDVGKSVEILKRCAKMDAKKICRFETYSPLGFNTGIASAEYFIGKCYEHGTGVQKHHSEAARWYTRAMEHGEGYSAANLGVIYLNGTISGKNKKMAEMCWKQGLNLGCAYSAEQLMEYYRRHYEPEMAWVMLKIGREMGNSKCLEMSDEAFNRDLTLVQSERCRLEEWVTELETDKCLGFKGMTFRERVTRAKEHVNTNIACMINPSIKIRSGGEIQSIDEDVMKTVCFRGFSGSKTAFEVMKALTSIFELNKLLGTQNESLKTQKLKAVNLFYECMILEDDLKWYVRKFSKLQAVLTELFQETCQQINEEEMKIRLCYVGFNLWAALNTPDDLYAFGILKEGIRRYPDNYNYHSLLIDSLIGRKSLEDGLLYVNKALEKFPEKIDLCFLKAKIFLNCKKMESSETTTVLKLFLDKAPRDHRHVPEVYYAISYVHMKDYLRYDHANDAENTYHEKLKLVQDNFTCGKDAEKDQLPCYLPYGESLCQLNVKVFLGRITEESKLDFSLKVHATNTASVEESNSVIERKEYLLSPVRKGLILQHRERLRDNVELNQNDLPFDDRVILGKLQQKMAKKMGHLKSITLQEMNPTKDRIYENRILDLTIIEEPNKYSNSIQLIAEDDNGDTTRVYVDAVATRNVFVDQFDAGSRIAVINPYMGICAGTRVNGIRINELKCIMYLEKVKDFCRFCGEENATRKCSKCKRLYCSRDCQKLDWQIFKHNLICLK